uniref:BRCA1/BRCA2-containing complex subunit 3 n=1 Tax=Saimiri boliviensis boliviensis TaxID=39432 RepID=A0A2K6V5R9_SAIBB
MAVQVVQAVQAVHLESDAFLVCLNHALSTEKEEVMGLCIGEVSSSVSLAGTLSDSKFAYTGTEMRTVAEKVDAVRIVHIHSVIILRRSDKRKDRVEISPEQLSAASTEAEISLLVNRSFYVLWGCWATLYIFGISFNLLLLEGTLESSSTGRVLYTCFQSIQAQKSSEYERIEIPIHIVPHVTIGKVCLESAVELPKILCQEEQDAYRRIHSLTHLDSVTKIHNGSVFTKNLCSQMSAVSGPLLQWLEDRLEQNQQHLRELQQEKEELMQELSSLE